MKQKYTLKLICRKNEEKYLKALIGKIVKNHEKFFETKFDPNLQVRIVYSRAEMNSILKKDTPPWMVANANKGKIEIFSPSVFEKVSPHSKKEFPKVLKHELCHIFADKFPALPRWLEEGLAGYVANQYNPNGHPKIKTLNKLYYKKDWDNEPLYQFSYFAVKYLVENYGKKKFFRLMSKANMNSALDEFNSIFKKIYSISVAEFDEILKNNLPS